MTLAVILFVSIFCAPNGLQVAPAHQSADQAAPASKPAADAATQTSNPPAQSTPSATKSTSSPADQTQTSKKPATPVHRKHKKRVASNCVPAASAPATSTSPASDTSQPAATGPDAAGKGETQTAQASAPVVCPPPKIVVRQGGTADPSIQLAGGAGGDQATRLRANQMLAATEENLKKIAGRQLAANQQDMLNQVHQFTAQSKSAIAAGDFERGRTLAWKAQLLSEELANPQK